eukprot:2856631-Rhodomonas_salina.2
MFCKRERAQQCGRGVTEGVDAAGDGLRDEGRVVVRVVGRVQRMPVPRQREGERVRARARERGCGAREPEHSTRMRTGGTRRTRPREREMVEGEGAKGERSAEQESERGGRGIKGDTSAGRGPCCPTTETRGNRNTRRPSNTCSRQQRTRHLRGSSAGFHTGQERSACECKPHDSKARWYGEREDGRVWLRVGREREGAGEEHRGRLRKQERVRKQHQGSRDAGRESAGLTRKGASAQRSRRSDSGSDPDRMRVCCVLRESALGHSDIRDETQLLDVTCVASVVGAWLGFGRVRVL